jgi:hypothetical protein
MLRGRLEGVRLPFIVAIGDYFAGLAKAELGNPLASPAFLVLEGAVPEPDEAGIGGSAGVSGLDE